LRGSSRCSGPSFEVELSFELGGLSETVYHALKPDNVMIPEGLEISMKVEGGKLLVRLSGREPRVLLSTANDIFECLELAVSAVRVGECST